MFRNIAIRGWRSLSSFNMATTYQPCVMSGPSGSGKSTLVKKLMADFKECFAFSVSHTTRSPRSGEVNGREYHFVSREDMQKAINNNEFVEHAEFSGNMYGTSKQSVRNVIQTGRICILDIDMQGVKSVKNTDLNCRYIFVKPPSMQVLEQRLRDRGTETEDSLHKRLETAVAELEYGEKPGSYDHIIVNDDLEVSYEKLKGILIQDIKMLLPSLKLQNGHSRFTKR